ncbi:MAG: NADPH-dependent F420 reductase [Betaproteobacteria bacterium]|nr:NADPH-dependent F420 reductase [Betaproteobacteria bacterium]
MSTGQAETIAVIGGTGAEGSGLALRWAAAGHRVIIGSRDASKARQVASELSALLPVGTIAGEESAAAAAAATIVVLAVPFAAQLPTAQALGRLLEGKILVDVTVPLVPPKVSTVQLPAGGSSVVLVQQMLGAGVKVVSAFQNVSAHKLKKLDTRIACDVLVCADDKDARQRVMQLAADAGLRGIDAGPLANSAAAEAMTSLLIWINRAYKVPDAGIAITGLP